MLTNRGDRGLFLVGRLRAGVTAAQAQSQLDVVAARLHGAYGRNMDRSHWRVPGW